MEAHRTSHQPVMDGDVVVVGGGAIGASIALELARAGRSVTLLERGELGSGCSAGTAGLVCPTHGGTLATSQNLRDGIVWMTRPESPLYLHPQPRLVPWLLRFAAAALAPGRAEAGSRALQRLSAASLRLHAELAESGVETTFERRGVLYAYETASGFEHATAAADATGLTRRPLGAAEARELEPALGKAVVGAIYVEDEGQLDSLRFVQAVGRAAAEAGAEIRTGVEVLGFRRAGRRVAALETTAGTIETEAVVLAAGVWTGRLAAKLGLTVPLEGAKGYHVEVAPSDTDPRIPVYMYESRVIATPLEGRLRVAGTLELGGGRDDADLRRVRALLAAARRNLGSVSGETLAVWRGLRPLTPDGLPVLGRPGDYDNLVLAAGHGMMGVALAPITGRLVSEVVTGEPPSHDLGLLDPDRFRLGRPLRRR